MDVRCVLAVLCLSLGSRAEPSCGNTKADVIAAVKRHYWSGCVYIADLQEEFNSDLRVTKSVTAMQRLLAERYIATTVLDVSMLVDAKLNFPCRYNRALVVILSMENGAPRQLQQLFARFYPSAPRWLLFVDNDTKYLEDIQDAVNIPFNCEFLVAQRQSTSSCEVMVLIEVYRVSEIYPLQISYWGSWVDNNLQAPVTSLYGRRNDLQGIALPAAAIDKYPYVTVEKEVTGDLKVTGFFPTLCQTLSEKLNFSAKMVLPHNNAYGIKDKNGSWTGAVGMMINGSIALTINPFQLTEGRMDVVDFTVPLLDAKATVYIQTVYNVQSTWKLYVSPLSISTWLADGVVFMCMACLLTLLHKLAQSHIETKSSGYKFSDSILCVWGSIWSQGDHRTPWLCSCRIVHWTAFLTGTVVLAVYSANFMSYLAVIKAVLPFTNLQELLYDNSYEFGVIPHRALYQTFQDSSNPIMEGLYSRKLLKHQNGLPESSLAGFYKACRSKFAFMIDNEDMLALHSQIPCDLTELPEGAIPHNHGLLLPKRSPYKGIINNMLQKIKRGGLYNKLYIQWIPQVSENEPQYPRSMDFKYIFPLLAVNMIGCLIGCIVLLLEIVFKNRFS